MKKLTLILTTMIVSLLLASLPALAAGKDASPPAIGDSVLKGFSTRYATIDLEAGSFRIDRVLLREKMAMLEPGKQVRFTLSYDQPEFPQGIVTGLSVLEGKITTCAGACL